MSPNYAALKKKYELERDMEIKGLSGAMAFMDLIMMPTFNEWLDEQGVPRPELKTTHPYLKRRLDEYEKNVRRVVAPIGLEQRAEVERDYRKYTPFDRWLHDQEAYERCFPQ